VGRSTHRVRLYGSAAVAASTLLAVAACGSSGTKTATPSSSPTSAASASSGSSAAPAGGITCNGSGTLTASGSTAQQNAISAWAKAYQAKCSGSIINYGGGGSGKGVTDFTAGTDDFAGSDFPLTSKQKAAADKVCTGGEAVDLPMTPGGIALAYNLPGVTDLNLSSGTLAKIFTGKIKTWDDAAIKADNPSAKLPSTTIQTFHRSDSSGTTYNFTAYLAGVAKTDWTYAFGKTWAAPGGQGAKGSAGVAQGVKGAAGAIGYMEVSYATQDKLGVAKVGDAGGKFVAPTGNTVAAFLTKASVAGTGDDLKLKFDYSSSDGSAYPVTLVTYEIVCTKGGKKAGLVKSFLAYTASTGQDILPGAGYVKLPTDLATKVAAVVDKIS
jgi:phosphate transport system substrate-binding protein